MSIRRILRLMAATWLIHFTMMSRSAFDSLLPVVWPLIFATATLLIYRTNGDQEALRRVALGVGVMSIWTAISSIGSGVLERERGFGTLELLAAAPAPFSLSVGSILAAVATIGGYGMAATLLWARLAFGVDLHIELPFAFGMSVLATLLSYAVLGFILSMTVVRYRDAWALGALLEYPVWLICGFVVPLAVLPEWVRPLSWILAPSWGMSAIRDAADGHQAWRAVACCVALTVLYGFIGIRLAGTVLRSARRNATLSLA